MTRDIVFDGKTHLSVPNDGSLEDVHSAIAQQIPIQSSDYYLTQNGKLLNEENLTNDASIQINLRLLGGKGGFGSMLRAIGAQIEKTTNREACRDLSGRRLRDINEEKRVKAWLEKQEDREEEAAVKNKKKIEKLLAKPKHEFKDEKYDAARQDLTQSVSDDLEEGLKKAIATTSAGSVSPSGSSEATSSSSQGITEAATSSGVKRKGSDDEKNKKKKKKKKKVKGALWVDSGLDDTSSDSDSSSGDSSKDTK